MTTVVVTLERRDLVRLTMHGLLRLRGNRIVFGLLGIVTAAIIFSKRGVPATVAEGVAQVATMALFWGAAVLVTIAVSQICIMFYSSENSGVLGTHHYTIRDDGLLEVTAANETLIKWGGASTLHKSAQYIWLQVSPGLFHVFPRRCFESTESYEQFGLALQRLVPNNTLQRMGAR